MQILLTLDTEKKLGDVLKNLPGIEINDEWRLLRLKERKLLKLLVEGKDFFDGDSKASNAKLTGKCSRKSGGFEKFH